MTTRQLAGAGLAALLVLGALGAFALSRIQSTEAQASRAAASARNAPQAPVAVSQADEPTGADEVAKESPQNGALVSDPNTLSDADIKARYEASKRRVAIREARAALKDKAWQEELRRMDSGANDQLVRRAAPTPEPAPDLGEAPDDGDEVEKAEKAKKPKRKGKTRIQYIFTTWCPHCVRLAPVISEMSRRPGVIVEGICTDKNPDACKEYLSKNRPPYSVDTLATDEGKRRSRSFGGTYAGPIPHLTVKSGPEVVYDRAGGYSPPRSIMNTLKDYL